MTGDDYLEVRTERTLPKAWEQEETFGDTLYEWMGRAPWLAISGAMHLVIFLIIQAVPWNLFAQDDEVVVQMDPTQAPEEIFEEQIEEEPEELEPEEPIEEPIIQDADIPEEEVDDFQTVDDFVVDQFESPFPDDNIGNVIGIGPGGGGKRSKRFGRGRPSGGSGTEQALKEALLWLKTHQDSDGKWDCDEFMKHDPIGDLCTGPGDPLHDVGVSGLALLAFLGDGSTLHGGPHKDVVTRGVRWLREQQDIETGLIGEEIGHNFLYDHSIASLAICEAYYFSKSALLRGTAQMSVNYIMRARNPYGAWRYEVPPNGDNDTSVTGWMVFALASAADAGLKVDDDAFVGALTWIEDATDPATGRVGYDSMGSVSSRINGLNDHFPPEKGEAMTAVGLLCRFFLGQDPAETPVMSKHAELLSRTPPEWDPEGYGCDMYYWYYGSYAMYQMGGRHWKEWNRAMKSAVVESQRRDGAHTGSWDPVGPWGHSGGRVYSTATMALCLEVYFRYARVIGAR